MPSSRLAVIALVACLAAGSAHAAPKLARLDGAPLTPAGIDAEVTRLMQANDVKGLAVALIRDGRVVYVKAYGRRDVDKDLPLTADTVMYGASLTKATFAYMVMQLVDEGRIDLDASIATYLPKPLPDYDKYADLKGDERWRKLTPRILLDHTSGFNNFRWLEPDEKLRFRRDPGARYGYSGEGINLMQFVVGGGRGPGRRGRDAAARVRPLRHDPHQPDLARRLRRERHHRLRARRQGRPASPSRQRAGRGLDGHHGLRLVPLPGRRGAGRGPERQGAA